MFHKTLHFRAQTNIKKQFIQVNRNFYVHIDIGITSITDSDVSIGRNKNIFAPFLRYGHLVDKFQYFI